MSEAPPAWRADQRQRRSVARPPVLGDRKRLDGAVPLIMAGDPGGLPPDTPAARVDPNTPDSPFNGVCSILVDFGGIGGRCSATPITDRHILTAAHCFDDDDDGTNDAGTNVTIVFNVDGDASLVIEPDGVLAVDLHPDYTGFSNPSLNDDLAIITLAEPLPANVQVYPVYRGELANAEIVELVGYGRSGSGADGITIPSSESVKRTGANVAEMFFADDEGAETLEVWSADFDFPTLNDPNCFGGTTLGNAIETSAAPGDSGGPAFIEVDGALRLWGVNSFGNNCAGPVFQFGGVSGGIVVNAYLPWIDTIVECLGNCNDCNGNGVADGVDIDSGVSADDDANGIPDECQFVNAGDLWIAQSNRLLGYSFSAGGLVRDVDPDLFFMQNVRAGAAGELLVVGDSFGPDGRGVYRLDRASGAVLGVLVPEDQGLENAVDVLIGSDGLLYVLNIGASSITPAFVTRHDPQSGALVDVFIADDPDTPEPEHGGVRFPHTMEFGPDGHLYVIDDFGVGVARFDGQTGAFLGPFAPDGPGSFGESALVFHDESLLVARDTAVLEFDATSGAFIGVLVPASHPSTNLIRDLAVRDGVLYVLNASINASVVRFDAATGAFLDALIGGGTLGGPSSMEFMPVDSSPADLTGDGSVDGADLLLMLGVWGDCPACPADLDGDGSVGVSDLLALLAAWS